MVQISREIHKGIMEIRKSGKTNMLDYKAVQYYADKLGHFALVCWIEDDPGLYGRGILEGFDVQLQPVE